MVKEKTIRNTNQRRHLLELLRSTTSHPNALWLYDNMKHSFPDLSLSTVYRNLGILQAQGLLLRLPCLSFDRYDGNTAVHAHFYCRRCERIYDIDTGNFEKGVFAGHIGGGHEIEGCNIILYGICETCKSK